MWKCFLCACANTLCAVKTRLQKGRSWARSDAASSSRCRRCWTTRSTRCWRRSCATRGSIGDERNSPAARRTATRPPAPPPQPVRRRRSRADACTGPLSASSANCSSSDRPTSRRETVRSDRNCTVHGGSEKVSC